MRCFVFTGIVEDWPATERWGPEYLDSRGVQRVGEYPSVIIDGKSLDSDRDLQFDCQPPDSDRMLGDNLYFSKFRVDGVW